MDKLMTFEEAAERLGTTPRHMRRLVIERRIAYRKLGRYVRFHPDDLAEYVAAHRVEAGQYPEVADGHRPATESAQALAGTLLGAGRPPALAQLRTQDRGATLAG
jgi:excisionase family DNA binding protein